MKRKISAQNLVGVPETLLIPLYARAVETQRPDAIIRDEKALEMVAHIDYDFSKFEEAHATNLGIAIRTEIFDEYVKAFIKQHPYAVVVNIAAGLDTRFFRTDNGYLTWYELDLPEAIDIRRAFVPDGERYHYIARSALDFDWMNDIHAPVTQDVLFIVEGLLMYFHEHDVKSLLLALADAFPGAEALIEVVGVSQAKKTRSDAVMKTGASFKWGIRDAASIAEWDHRITYQTDVSLYDRYPERWMALNLHFPAPLVELRNTVDRIVHLRFA